jgi:hypothetical protein
MRAANFQAGGNCLAGLQFPVMHQLPGHAKGGPEFYNDPSFNSAQFWPARASGTRGSAKPAVERHTQTNRATVIQRRIHPDGVR